MESNAPTTKNTNAFFAQAAIAFGVSLMTMLVAIFYLPSLPRPRDAVPDDLGLHARQVRA